MAPQPTPPSSKSAASAALAGFRLRYKTLAGLAVVAVVGGALSLAFFRSHQVPTQTLASSGGAAPPRLSHQAGRIVPLMIDGAAEERAAVDARRAGQGRVQVLPSIRRPLDGTDPSASPPELSQVFPQAFALAGIAQLQPPTIEPSLPFAGENVVKRIPPVDEAGGDSARERPAAPQFTPAPLPPADAPATHRIVDGDTLADLAARYLGDAARANEIFDCNRRVLDSPDLLPIGAVLKLPAK